MAQTPVQAERSKERDLDSIVRYLTSTFNSAISKAEKPFRSATTGKANMTYLMQTEFAYLINEVMQGPRGVLQKNIAACNEYIDTCIQVIADK